MKERWLAVFCLLLLSSCTKVLVLRDPAFDYLASIEIPFYEGWLRGQYFLRGYNPYFVDFQINDELTGQVQALLDTGEFQKLILGYIFSYGLRIPEGMDAVMIGGMVQGNYPQFTQVGSKLDKAYKEISLRAYRLWERGGIEPIVIYAESPLSDKVAAAALQEPWGEELSVLKKNWLSLSWGGKQAWQNKIEAFINTFDLISKEYSFIVLNPAVVPDFILFAPTSGHYIFLGVGDNSHLPSNVRALVVEDYRRIVKVALDALADPVPGGIELVSLRVKNK